MLKTRIVLLTLLLTQFVYSQQKDNCGISVKKKAEQVHIFDTVVFRGIVYENRTNEVCIGATVFLKSEGLKCGTASDADGKFKFSVPTSYLADTFYLEIAYPQFYKKSIAFTKVFVECEYQVVLGIELNEVTDCDCCVCFLNTPCRLVEYKPCEACKSAATQSEIYKKPI